jgi:hypothetical protein
MYILYNSNEEFVDEMTGPDGYAFEKVVADELRALGYPVFYQNLKMRINGITFIEFDIVSLDFIVEVKAGKSIRTCGLDLLYSHRRLPENFMIYVYCAAKTDAEIAEQNENKLENILYINDLRQIVASHPPRNICNIKSAKNLNRFLRIPYEIMCSFDKIYIQKESFDKIYYGLNHIRDWCSKSNGLKHSNKLQYLIDHGKIIYVDKFDYHVPDFNLYYLNEGVMNLKEMNNIIIPLVYRHSSYSQYKEQWVGIEPARC